MFCRVGSKILKLGHVPRATPIWGHCEVYTQEGSVLHLCTKFEADRSIYSKVIRWGPKFYKLGRDPGNAELRVVLWSTRRRVRPLWLYQILSG